VCARARARARACVGSVDKRTFQHDSTGKLCYLFPCSNVLCHTEYKTHPLFEFNST